MKIAFFNTHHFDKDAFLAVNSRYNLQIDFFETSLNSKTVGLAQGYEVVCSFVNDKLDEACLEILASLGVKMIALRSAGFNHVDLVAADRLGLLVTRVPAYSPNAIAEFAVGLLLGLNRKIHKAYLRVREQNFSLDGLVGFDLNQKTVGVVGSGKIGKIFARVMCSFGAQVLVFDLNRDPELESLPGVKYVGFQELCKRSDIISLHIPLTPSTYHIIGQESLNSMKKGVFIINTGRGALIDAKALIEALKEGSVGGAALDVYEEEENIFFSDLSDKILKDDTLARLMSFPNVLLTSHQAFLTQEALENIATSTLGSIDEFLKTGKVEGEQVVSSKRYR